MMSRRLALTGTLMGALSLVPVGAAVRPPRMNYQMTTLANGFTVVLSEIIPAVAHAGSVHVGSMMSDPDRRALVRHMMSKA